MSFMVVLLFSVGVFITQMVLHDKQRSQDGKNIMQDFDTSFGLKEEECEFCGAVFDKQHLLRKHMKNHANETKKRKGGNEPREFRCRFCNEPFEKSQALGGHMNRHHDERAKEKVRSVLEMYGMQGVQNLMAQIPQSQQANMEGLIPMMSYAPMPATTNEVELLQGLAHNFNMVPQHTLNTQSNLHPTSSNKWQLPQIQQQSQHQAPQPHPGQLQQQIFSQQQQQQQQQAPGSLSAQLQQQIYSEQQQQAPESLSAQLQQQIYSEQQQQAPESLSAQLQQQIYSEQQQQAPESLPAQLQQQIYSQQQQQQQQQQFCQQLPQMQLEKQYSPQASLLGHRMMPSPNSVNKRPRTAAGFYNTNLGGGPPSTGTEGIATPGDSYEALFMNPNINLQAGQHSGPDYDPTSESFLLNDVLEDTNSSSPSISQGYNGFKARDK